MDLAGKARFKSIVRVTRSQLLVSHHHKQLTTHEFKFGPTTARGLICNTNHKDDGFLLGHVNSPPYKVVRPSARCIRSLNFLQVSVFRAGSTTRDLVPDIRKSSIANSTVSRAAGKPQSMTTASTSASASIWSTWIMK
jgi:hypothetical protein